MLVKVTIVALTSVNANNSAHASDHVLFDWQ